MDASSRQAAVPVHRAVVAAGLVLVALYVAAAAVTALRAPGGMRPLFDGFASHPGQYLWVDPPNEFAVGNTRPEKAQAGVAFDAAGSMASNATPPDGQAIAALVPGAVPRREGDESAVVRLEPFDAADLGALPAGLRPEGNAYRVTVTYEPSRTPLTTLAKEATIGLTAAAAPDILLYSADGTTWERKDSLPLKQGIGLSGLFTETGYFLAANEGPLRAASGGGGGVPVALIAAGLAVPLVLGFLLLGRRGASAGAGRRRAKGGARPTGKASGAGKGGGAKGTGSGKAGRANPPGDGKPRPNQKRTAGSPKKKRR